MNKDNKKLITVSFLLAAALIAFVSGLLLETFSASSALIARFASYDVVQHGLPVTIGLLTFGMLQFNKKSVTFAEEVLVELGKVVWPSRKDTVAMTIVVCIMVVIAGVALSMFDFISNHVIRLLVH